MHQFRSPSTSLTNPPSISENTSVINQTKKALLVDFCQQIKFNEVGTEN